MIKKEGQKKKKERAQKIYQTLLEEFPDPKCALNHKNPFELLIATILSAQCTDIAVNKVTPALFSLYPNPKSMSEAPLESLENLIRTIGLFRSKAKNIQLCAQSLVENFQGNVPSTMEELTSLSGVGRKTANVVLGNIFGINAGIVVDTHVKRLSTILNLSTGNTPLKIEQDLMKLFDRPKWCILSHLLILHGRKTCIARRPRCEICSISSLCPEK